MEEKLKYNFLHSIPLHCSKFYNCFLLCCAQGCHFFCNAECLKQGTGILSKGQKFKKVPYKKNFTELFLHSCHFVLEPFSEQKSNND